MISSGSSSGMISMDNSLAALWKQGLITSDTALTYCQESEQMKGKLRR